MKFNFTDEEISRIVEMAWEDRPPLDAIERLFGINETALKKLMQEKLTARSYSLWRKRMRNSRLRHESLRPSGITRAYASNQYKQKS